MGRRSIPVARFARALRKQKHEFGSTKTPWHPDAEMFRPENQHQVIDWMASWKIEPYWGNHPGTGTTGLMFRSIPTSKGLVHIRHAVDDIALYRRGLGLMMQNEQELQERLATIQEMIRRKAGLLEAPFPTRHPRR